MILSDELSDACTTNNLLALALHLEVSPIMEVSHASNYGVLNYEPLQAKPLQMELLQVEPFQVEPLQMEPLQVEPLQVEPLQVEPLQVEPLRQKIKLMNSIFDVLGRGKKYVIYYA